MQIRQIHRLGHCRRTAPYFKCHNLMFRNTLFIPNFIMSTAPRYEMGRVSEFYRKPSTDADRRTDGRGRRTDAAPRRPGVKARTRVQVVRRKVKRKTTQSRTCETYLEKGGRANLPIVLQFRLAGETSDNSTGTGGGKWGRVLIHLSLTPNTELHFLHFMRV